MRPSGTVARALLIAALALGALPGLVGSHQPSHDRPIEAAAFRPVTLATARTRQDPGIVVPDAAGESADSLLPDELLAELGSDGSLGSTRANPALPGARPISTWRKPRYTITGSASFYDNGTTAMRLPRGTVVVICMAGGCIERVVTDYGPVTPERIVDLDREDFFAICGCPSWSGVEPVTVKVY
jgi:hypothetical protein